MVPTYHLLVGAACLALGLALRRRLFRPGEPVDAPDLADDVELPDYL